MTEATLDLGQFKRVGYLENGSNFTDSMLFRDDFVKYYYYRFPDRGLANQTFTINISGVTPGFKASIYALSNEIINSTYSYANLVYPTLTQYSVNNE